MAMVLMTFLSSLPLLQQHRVGWSGDTYTGFLSMVTRDTSAVFFLLLLLLLLQYSLLFPFDL